jgi:N-acetylmuramoyl-L-alanine amidase
MGGIPIGRMARAMHPAVMSRPWLQAASSVQTWSHQIDSCCARRCEFCVLVSIIDEPSASASANIAGMAVFLDPGHNGANDSSITRQVRLGRARMRLSRQRNRCNADLP